MGPNHENPNRPHRWMRWTARIWSAPIMVYALILFVGYTWSWLTTGVADPYAVEGTPPGEALPPILLLLSILGLALAWRWERWGGTIAIVFQLAALVTLLVQRPIASNFPSSAIPYFLVLFAVVPSILFLLCGRKGPPIPQDVAQSA